MQSFPISILVVASPIPSHPSTGVIDETLASITRYVAYPSGIDRLPLVISHDGPSFFSGWKARRDFRGYREGLERLYRDRATLVWRARKGGLTRNIAQGLRQITTPLVLIVQHDLAFCQEVPLEKVVRVFIQNQDVKHLRFNLRDNDQPGWDGETPPAMTEPIQIRAEFFHQVELLPGIPGMQTLGWGDNNHVTRLEYYKDLVFPVVGVRSIPPERAMTPLPTPENHSVFGTYVWGGRAQTAVLTHLDGRNARSRWWSKLQARFGGVRFWAHRLRMVIWAGSFSISRNRFNRLADDKRAKVSDPAVPTTSKVGG